MRQCSSLEFKVQHLPIQDEEVDSQLMLLLGLFGALFVVHFLVKFGAVKQEDVLLFVWLEISLTRPDLKDLLIQNHFFDSGLLRLFPGVGPRLCPNLVIVRKLEAPVEIRSANILYGHNDLSWLHLGLIL